MTVSKCLFAIWAVVSLARGAVGLDVRSRPTAHRFVSRSITSTNTGTSPLRQVVRRAIPTASAVGNIPVTSGSSVMSGAKLAHVVFHVRSAAESAALLEATCGMAVQRTDAKGNMFVGFGSEANGEHLAIKLVEHSGDEKFNVGTALAGVVVAVDDVQAAAEAAKENGAEVTFGPIPYVLGPAMVPDEPVDKRTTMVRAVIKEPNGYQLELLQREPAPRDRLLGATLLVTQLERGIKFYTELLGMTLHRKQSLLPNAAAQAAFLNFDKDPEQSAFLELKYIYNTKKVDVGSYGTQIVIAAPDVDTVATTLATTVTGPSPLDGVGDSVAVALDPEGVDLLLLDELEFMTQTL